MWHDRGTNNYSLLSKIQKIQKVSNTLIHGWKSNERIHVGVWLVLQSISKAVSTVELPAGPASNVLGNSEQTPPCKTWRAFRTVPTRWFVIILHESKKVIIPVPCRVLKCAWSHSVTMYILYPRMYFLIEHHKHERHSVGLLCMHFSPRKSVYKILQGSKIGSNINKYDLNVSISLQWEIKIHLNQVTCRESRLVLEVAQRIGFCMSSTAVQNGRVSLTACRHCRMSTQTLSCCSISFNLQCILMREITTLSKDTIHDARQPSHDRVPSCIWATVHLTGTYWQCWGFNTLQDKCSDSFT